MADANPDTDKQMTEKDKKFKNMLDDHHQWPCPYVFKFIVPSGQMERFHELFPDAPLTTRQSKSGKYTSVTLESTMCSSHDVMAIYEKAGKIPGIMSL